MKIDLKTFKNQNSDSGNTLPIQNMFISVCTTDVLSQHPHYHSDQILFIKFTLTSGKCLK